MDDGIHYTACGLSNVWLKAGYEIKDSDEGPRLRVTDRGDLQRALAYALIGRAGCLTGQEFRFLRRMMGLTQPRLSTLMGFSRHAVARWESRDRVPLACDRCLRQWTLAWLSGRMDWPDRVEQAQRLDLLTEHRYEVVQEGSRLQVRTQSSLLAQPVVLG